jgi:hypothetical protein
MQQRVLVCTDDPVLAKRVRFLLARDECEVKIVEADQLEADAQTDPPQLMVVSHAVAEALDLDRLQNLAFRTLVLGAPAEMAKDRVEVVPDASNAQALYATASQLLNRAGPTGGEPAGDGEPATEHAMRIRPDTEIELPPEPADTVAEEDEPKGAEAPLASVDASVDGPPTEHTGIDPGELAKAIFKTHAQRSSGVLIIERPDETLRLEFEAGAPVRLASSVPGDRFGRSLVERGRLNEAQYAEAAKRAIETGIELGRALVETRAFTPEQLAEERAEYARLQVVDRFKPVTGSFRYERGAKVQDPERTFSLPILPVVGEGFKQYAAEDVVRRIVGDREERYFEVRTSAEEVGEQFVLPEAEVEFLRYGGRAYNVADAAEMAGLDLGEALTLLAMLWTCEKVQDFTPGIEEFEARIREERQRTKDLESKSQDLPSPSPSPSMPMSSAVPVPPPAEPEPISFAEAPDDEPVPLSGNGVPGLSRSEAPVFSPPAVPPPAPPPPMPGSDPSGPSLPASSPAAPASTPRAGVPSSSPSAPPPPPADDAPSMPVPAPGQDGAVPSPMAYADPLPRGPDGTLLETPERSQSREHFQRGVQLLGQGQFEGAEQAFREAVALCSEEHVYLVGLARAIFYNPSYRADGKLPLLRAIVGRAESLARDDKRVQNLRYWVEAAEREHLR